MLLGSTLEKLSSMIVAYANKNYLAINEQKTQVLWSPCKGFPIRVGSCMVSPSDKLDVLGVSFDKMLSPNPHVNSLITSTRSMTAIAKRLALHLPVDLLKRGRDVLATDTIRHIGDKTYWRQKQKQTYWLQQHRTYWRQFFLYLFWGVGAWVGVQGVKGRVLNRPIGPKYFSGKQDMFFGKLPTYIYSNKFYISFKTLLGGSLTPLHPSIAFLVKYM